MAAIDGIDPMPPMDPAGATDAASRLDAAWLLVGADGRLRYASPAARATLAVPQAAEAVPPAVAPLVERARNGEGTARGTLAGTFGPVEAWVSLEADGTALIGLSLPAGAEDLDLQHAAQLRNLARVYMGVVHDLRAPVNAITLNLELLKRALAVDEDGDERDLARRRQWAHVIGEELERLARSLDLVLTQAAPAASARVTFDVAELLIGIERLLAAQARQRRVKLELHVPDDAVRVNADHYALRQAVIALAVNALDATPEGGRLALTAALHENAVRITVSDTGPGLPEPVRAQPFVRRPGSHGGTALGLHVASRIAAGEGGSLRLVETGPSGTTFEFELPAWNPPA